MFVKIFGIILVAIGPFLVIKTEWFLENFGRIDWAEEHLALQGGTRFFYKIGGILFIFIGLMMLFDLFGPMVIWIFGPLFPNRG